MSQDSKKQDRTHERQYTERVEAALAQLAAGGVVVVVDDFGRENEGDLIAVSELTTEETVNFMVTHARGMVCQPITAERARELELPLMVSRVTDPHRTAFTVTVDHRDSTTGISAGERARTIRSLTEAETKPEDLRRPGHIFPLIAKEGGVFERRGHTEAAVDMARLAGCSPSGIVCEIMNEDGSMARLAELELFATEHGLPLLSVEDLVRYRDAIGDVPVERLSESRLPTEFGEFRVSVYHSGDPAAEDLILLESDGEVGAEGEPGADGESAGTPLLRLHSECLTGEAFGSRRCDCGPQLATSLERIGREGGALVYLRQEGRGIGLAEKIRAYALQDGGMDTVEANLALGHQADGRRFGAAAAVLRSRGYREVRLLTNNPEKEASLRRAGIRVVERETLSVGITPENRSYLQTKISKFGHALQGV